MALATDTAGMNAVELCRRLRRRDISPVELTTIALDEAERRQADLNAFSLIDREGALAAARAAETALLRGGGEAGALCGLPVSVKDLVAVKGLPLEFGSRTMKGNRATVDAPSVERLRRAGAVIVGKTTTSEFGCKPLGDSPASGVTRNPLDLSASPGGSSAGAAASVAAGITTLALGTDGGGSLRIPASLTGLVGFKATFGRVPVWPVSATPTLAHVGALARTVEDAALLASVTAGRDERDGFSVPVQVPDFTATCGASVEGLRIAWSATLGYAAPQPEVARIAEAAIRSLEDAGAAVERVETVFDDDPIDLWMAEFYAGVGTRLRSAIEATPDLLDPAVLAVLRPALGQTLYDYYATVFRRYALRERMAAFFERFDLLATPTLPVSRVPLGVAAPLGYEHLGLIGWVSYTYPFNLTGQPAISVPAGLGKNGSPVGLQIVGPPLREDRVLAAAAAVERLRPALAPPSQPAAQA